MQAISPACICKYTFFAGHDALFREFFYLYIRLMQKYDFMRYTFSI